MIMTDKKKTGIYQNTIIKGEINYGEEKILCNKKRI